MLQEIVRMLKPRGELALVDFIFTDECEQVLRKAHINNVRALASDRSSHSGLRQLSSRTL